MSLYNKINEDLKQSMRDKDKERVMVLRMLVSSLKNKAIDLKVDGDLSDEQVIVVIKSEVKKRKDSVQSYIDGGREDLAEAEKNEIEILDEYLPEQLSDEQIEVLVQEVIESIGEVTMQDFGRIMGAAVTKAQGNADGDRISAIVKSKIAK